MGKFHSAVGIGSALLNEVVVCIGEEGQAINPYYITPGEARTLAQSLLDMANTVEKLYKASTCPTCGDS